MQLNNLFFAMHFHTQNTTNNVKKYYGNRRERFIWFYCSIYRMGHTLGGMLYECFKKARSFQSWHFHTKINSEIELIFFDIFLIVLLYVIISRGGNHWSKKCTINYISTNSERMDIMLHRYDFRGHKALTFLDVTLIY